MRSRHAERKRAVAGVAEPDLVARKPLKWRIKEPTAPPDKPLGRRVASG